MTQILHIALKILNSSHLATARARAIVQIRIAFSFQSNAIIILLLLLLLFEYEYMKIYENRIYDFHIFIFIYFHYHRVYHKLTIDHLSMWLGSSVDRALHQYRKVMGSNPIQA